MNIVFVFSMVLMCLHSIAFAQGTPIQDNSFLLEEAYNQEAGVIQHINAFRRTDEGVWIYNFTDEWPVLSQLHQLSVTVPVQGSSEGSSGIGDLLINYRYQLTGSGSTNIAVAPRLSLIFPTGNEIEGRGGGGMGVQGNFPVSAVLNRKLVSHFNVGLTHTPSAKNRFQQKANTTSVNVGQSFIYEPTSKFNLMLEAAWENLEIITGQRTTDREYTFFLNPGIRWAHNFSSGLQIVPGIAVPIGLGPSSGETGIFLYLSFEHPIMK